MKFYFNYFGKWGDFMNKPNRNKSAKYQTVNQVMSDINLCRGMVVKIAKDADAYIHIGRAVRIDAKRFFDYVDSEFKE